VKSAKRLLSQVKRSGQASTKSTSDSDSKKVTAAVLSALGACEAHRGQFVNFDKDQHLITETNQLIKERQQLAMEHDRLVQEHNKSVPAVNAEVHGRTRLDSKYVDFLWIVQQIKHLDARIQNIEEQASPAFRLKLVLSQAQHYPVEVRQGAAMGLRYLLCSPRITQDARGQIETLLSTCLDDPSAVDFRTYQVRLMPGSTPGEVTYELRRGLLWMVRDTAAMALYATGLYQTVCDLCHYLPDAVSFLERYPLRLMSPEDHRGVLGNYIERGFDLIHWTQYTPPKDIGQVHERWNEVVDRTTPNSMGISYPLFRHRCLVLPIVFHEYLHYCGEGNEAKVWLREWLFQKSLIADLSPPDNKALSAYEMEIRRLLDEVAGTESVELLRHDASELSLFSDLNVLITKLYGPQLSSDVAASHANTVVDEADIMIQMMNAELSWCPEIRYPLLKTPEGEDQRSQIFKIVKRRKMQRNTIEKNEFEAILAEPESKAQLAKWHQYAGRQGAAVALFAPPLAGTGVSLLALVDARRHHVNVMDVLSMLQDVSDS
jgi:hypothetical protein